MGDKEIQKFLNTIEVIPYVLERFAWGSITQGPQVLIGVYQNGMRHDLCYDDDDGVGAAKGGNASFLLITSLLWLLEI